MKACPRCTLAVTAESVKLLGPKCKTLACCGYSLEKGEYLSLIRRKANLARRNPRGGRKWQVVRLVRMVTCKTCGEEMGVRAFRLHMTVCGKPGPWVCPVGCGKEFKRLEMYRHIGGCRR